MYIVIIMYLPMEIGNYYIFVGIRRKNFTTLVGPKSIYPVLKKGIHVYALDSESKTCSRPRYYVILYKYLPILTCKSKSTHLKIIMLEFTPTTPSSRRSIRSRLLAIIIIIKYVYIVKYTFKSPGELCGVIHIEYLYLRYK